MGLKECSRKILKMRKGEITLFKKATPLRIAFENFNHFTLLLKTKIDVVIINEKKHNPQPEVFFQYPPQYVPSLKTKPHT